ncbi:MAG: response regulator [Caldilineaceae bacterium]
MDGAAEDSATSSYDLRHNPFLLNISHELRTHMNGVVGMADLLQETTLSPQQREYVRTIRSAGDSLLHIVNDILDLSKIDAHTMSLDAHPFDLQQAVEGAIDLVTANALAKSTEIYYWIQQDAPVMLIGDMIRLRQILVNLLSNAVKFTQNGEIVVKIDGQPKGDNRHQLHFTVSDTGIGIPTQEQESLFHPFRQIDPAQSGNSMGAGLGLVVSKQLAQLMGGDIWLESTVGQGATFHFTIDTESVEASTYQHRNTDRYLRNRTALVIAGKAASREPLTNYLERWGIQVLATPDVAAALPLLQSERPIDVVIFDAALADGPSAKQDMQNLADQLANLELYQATPVIVLAPIYDHSKYAAFEGRAAADASLQSQGAGDDAPMLVKPHRSGKVFCLAKPVKMWMLHERLVQLFEGDALVSAPVSHTKAPVAARSLRILLVEDNAVNQMVTLRILERLGYQADLARNGAEALQAAHRCQYDLVLMDIVLPDIDGVEVTRRLRALEINSPRQIIAMTATAAPAEMERAMQAGMEGYITKPFRLNQVKDLLLQTGRAVAQK